MSEIRINTGKVRDWVQEAGAIAQQRNLDLVLIDGSPGIGCPVIASITGADLVLIVTEPTLSGLHDLGRVADVAKHFGIPGLVCVNKWDLNHRMTEEIDTVEAGAIVVATGFKAFDPTALVSYGYGIYPEVYTSLEQKTIDGAENSPVLLFTSKHWEVSKVYSMTEQFWLVSALFTSKKYWDTLPADIQQQIRKAADAAKWYCRYIYLEDENVAFAKLQGVDVKVIRDVDAGAFKTAVQPVWQRYVKKYPYADDWIKQIQATPAD